MAFAESLRQNGGKFDPQWQRLRPLVAGLQACGLGGQCQRGLTRPLLFDRHILGSYGQHCEPQDRSAEIRFEFCPDALDSFHATDSQPAATAG
jgi:hypothetical protein